MLKKIPDFLKNQSGSLKKGIAAVLVAVLAIGAVSGGLFAYKGLTKKPVNTYSVMDFCMTDYWGDSSETSGSVSTEGMQKVMVSDSQTVTKIYVTEGQTVKKGEKLLAYDTTLTSIDIKRAEIAVSKKELELENAEKELSKIKAMKVGLVDSDIFLAAADNMVILANVDDGTDSDTAESDTAESDTAESDTAESSVAAQISISSLILLSGSGSKSDPYIYVMPENYVLSQTSLRQMYNGEGRLKNEDSEDPSEDTDPDDTGDTGDGGNAAGDTGSGSDSGDSGNTGSDSGNTGSDSGDSSDENGSAAGENEVTRSTDKNADVFATAGNHVANTADTTGNVVYVILQIREGNVLSGSVTSYYGLRLGESGQEIVMGFYTPEADSGDDGGDDYGGGDYYGGDDYGGGGSGYTASEIAQMRNEKEQEISNLKIEIQLAKIDLQKKKDEFNNGAIVSQVDGTVKTVRDATEAYMNGEPVIEVSGGGGYYIQGTMSELELGNMQIGQTVTVSSWETGVSCDGTITEISDVPVTDGSGWTNGNTNVSYYPFTVFVDEDADFTEFDYVEISYTAAAEDSGDSWYLESEFIRTDNGQNYVYVLGDNGKLKKQSVSIGKNVWGMYTEIKGGLTLDDYVAFPYGDAKDGAKAVQADSSEFYEN